MPYARMDDRYDDHRKIKRAWRREPAAVALHAMAITYCNRHTTDGLVDVEWVEERLALLPYKPRQRAAVLTVLLELGLLERHDDEHFVVHDFLDWNLSRAQRERLSRQGRRGGMGRPNGKPPDDEGSSPVPSEGLSNGSSQGSSQGLSEGSSPAESEGLSTPLHSTPTPTPRQEASPLSERKSSKRADQNALPISLPEPLRPVARQALPMLEALQEERGGNVPTLRGVGMAIEAWPDRDHLGVARELQHWALAGTGQGKPVKDWARTFSTFLERAPAGAPARTLHVLSPKENPSEIWRGIYGGDAA